MDVHNYAIYIVDLTHAKEAALAAVQRHAVYLEVPIAHLLVVSLLVLELVRTAIVLQDAALQQRVHRAAARVAV